MSNPEPPDHFSIGEVLAMLHPDYPDVTVSKIRFLESQGLLNPERTPSGYRKFRDHDIDQLRWILRQQQEHFLPLKVIKQRLAAGQIDEPVGAVVPANGQYADSVEHHGADQVVANDVPTPVPAGRPAMPPHPAPSAANPVADDSQPQDLLSGMVSSITMGASELCSATGLTRAQLAELERMGLITPDEPVDADPTMTPSGRPAYGDDALVIARSAADLARHGLEMRHLRMFKVAADREAGLYEQAVGPQLRRSDPGVRHQAAADVAAMTATAARLHAALLNRALRPELRRS